VEGRKKIRGIFQFGEFGESGWFVLTYFPEGIQDVGKGSGCGARF